MTPLDLHSAAETEALGGALRRVLGGLPGVVIYLEGPLGAGKTTLARGLLRAAGVQGPIRSPSFTLLEPYALRAGTVLHVDLYRLNHPDELHPLGLADFPPDRCWWMVEWPGHGGGVLPPADLQITLGYAPAGRQARLAGPLADAALERALRRELPSAWAPTPS